LGLLPNSSSRPTELATLTGSGHNAPALPLALIQKGVWKEFSEKLGVRETRLIQLFGS
jgi:hypothetical protein